MFYYEQLRDFLFCLLDRIKEKGKWEYLEYKNCITQYWDIC